MVWSKQDVPENTAREKSNSPQHIKSSLTEMPLIADVFYLFIGPCVGCSLSEKHFSLLKTHGSMPSPERNADSCLCDSQQS
jgi:hypothetical protein